MFNNRYKQWNITENCNNFLKKREKLKFYKIKFNKDNAIKATIYLFDCKVRKLNLCLIIRILYM